MNEQIRELAKEAGLIQYDTDGKKEDVEKFAELIVRECAQKLENDGMVEVAMEIKQHFA